MEPLNSLEKGTLLLYCTNALAGYKCTLADPIPRQSSDEGCHLLIRIIG